MNRLRQEKDIQFTIITIKIKKKNYNVNLCQLDEWKFIWPEREGAQKSERGRENDNDEKYKFEIKHGCSMRRDDQLTNRNQTFDSTYN